MQTVTLKATPRPQAGKGPARRLRAAGQLPCVAYGEIDSQPLAIERNALRDILTSPRGRNTIINLDVEGGATVAVMVKEYTVHPLSRLLLHADFITINESKPVECEVPFRTTGKSKGEAAGGTLLANIRNLRVRCLPTAIPDVINFDVSALEIDDVVVVRELTMPPNVEALLPPERKIVVVAPPRVLEVTEEEAAAAAAAEAEAAEGGEGAEGDDAKPAEGDDKKKD